MNHRSAFLTFLLVSVLARAADPAVPRDSAAHSTGEWSYVDIRRFPAPEARQGVAADDEFLYVISNHALGKYRKETGVRVASWDPYERGVLYTISKAGREIIVGRVARAKSGTPR